MINVLGGQHSFGCFFIRILLFPIQPQNKRTKKKQKTPRLKQRKLWCPFPLVYLLVVVLTSVFRCDKVHIPHVLAAGLDVMMDGVGRHGADLHEAVVLYEDGVAREVPVNDGRHAAVKVANRNYNNIDIL